MIRPYIQKQLKKCIFAKLDTFDEKTNTYHIAKYTKPKYEVGKGYLIQIPKYLINNTTSVLATNWNNGRSPQNEYYKAYVNKFKGSYIYVDCLAYDYQTKQDLSNMWSGWLDINELQQLSTL